MAGGTINLAVKTTNDASGLKAASADLDAFGKSAATAGGQMDAFDKKQAAAAKNLSDNMVKASAVASVGILALGGLAIKTAADFERSMDQVGAVAGATASEMGQLSAAAKSIGADTAFSASQAAGAMEELAAGGRSVAQILGGEARAAVDLAAAGNYGLAESGRTIATVMDVWKNTQLSTNEVVNRLAGAANASRFGVEDMSGAISQAGGVAAQMGVEFDDFTAAIASTASSFASGSDAGTSYKTFLLSLDGSTDKAKQKIEELGLEFRDQNGHIKSTAEIAQELADKVGILGEAEQTAALKVIFGNDAYRTAAGLMDATAEGVTKVNDVLANTNAADIAEQRMSNLAGSFEAFKGSAETLAISIGEKALPAMTNITDAGTAALNAFGGLPESTQGMALGFTALAVAAPAAMAGLSKAASTISLLSTGAASAQLKVGALAVGIGALAIGVDVLLNKTTGHGLMERIIGDVSRADAASEAAREFAGAIAETEPGAERMAAITERLARELGRFESQAVEAGNEVNSFGHAIGGADGRFFGFNVGLSDGVDNFKEYEEKVRAAAEAMVANGATTAELHSVYLTLPPVLREVFDEATNLRNLLPELGTAMGDVVGGGAATAAGSVRDAAGAFGTLVEVAPGVTQVMGEFAAQVAFAASEGEGFADVMDRINQTIATTNPEVIALSASNAILQESIDDIKASGDELTEAQTAQVEALEAQIAANDAVIASHASNQEAMEGVQAHLQLLMGEAGYAGLAAAMVDTGRESESMVDVTSSVREAFGLLASGDLPNAEAAFISLKGELTPEEWGEIAKAIGVRFPEQVAAGFLAGEEGIRQGGVSLGVAAESGLWSMEPNIFLAGQGLGESAASGMEAGIMANVGRVAAAAATMVGNAIAAAGAAQESRSPSRKYRLLGLSAGDGYVEGLEQSTAGVMSAASEMVTAGLENGESDLARLLRLLATLDPDARAAWIANPANVAAIGDLRLAEAGLPPFVAPHPGGASGIVAPGQTPAPMPTGGNTPIGTFPGAGGQSMADSEIANAMGSGFLGSLDPKIRDAIGVQYQAYLAGTLSRDQMWNAINNYGYQEYRALQANGGLSVYQDSAGVWRDLISGEVAIGADGRFLTDQYRSDALKWNGNQQNNPGQFTGRGLQAAAPAKQGAMGEFLKSLGMNRDNLGDRAGAINNFDWFTTKEDWAQLGFGADSEWASDPWFGFVPKEWLNSQAGAQYLGLRGIDPLNNPATRADYNPWHPNAMGDGGTRVSNRDGTFRTVYNRPAPAGYDPNAPKGGQQVVINVNAMDAASFLRFAPQIREALGMDAKGSY